MTRETLLRLDCVGKSFADRPALQNISFTLGRGEILTLLGPSGCGKTTILRMIAGLAASDHGTIARAPSLNTRGSIGYVFQDATLMPWADALTNVALPLTLSGTSRDDAERQAATMLARVGLGDRAQAAPHELSGGMKMRVALARALVTQPALLLMDEPFAALDEITRHALNDEMLHLVRTSGTAVLFVTHSVAEAAYLSDRIAILTRRPGRVQTEMAMPWSAVRNPSLRYEVAFAQETARLSDALGRAMADHLGVDDHGTDHHGVDAA